MAEFQKEESWYVTLIYFNLSEIVPLSLMLRGFAATPPSAVGGIPDAGTPGRAPLVAKRPAAYGAFPPALVPAVVKRSPHPHRGSRQGVPPGARGSRGSRQERVDRVSNTRDPLLPHEDSLDDLGPDDSMDYDSEANP